MGFNGFRKPGGGFLHGVSGVIVGYKFDTKVFESKKKGVEDYTKASVELNILQDGATVPVKQFLDAGFLYDGQTVSADGLSLESDDERPILAPDTEFAKFIMSMFEAGLPEDALQDDGRNYEGLLGYRVTFAKINDEEKQLAIGASRLGAKAKTATREALLEAGKQVDKKDPKKSYNQQYLAVSAVLGKSDVKASKKTAVTVTTKPAASKRNGKVEAMDEQPVVDVLISLLADAADNTLPTNKLSSLFVHYALANGIKGEERETMRKLISSAPFVASERGWTVDAKAGTVTLA